MNSSNKKYLSDESDELNERSRISRGPMKNILGIFEHWTSDQGRVRVLLNFINYHATVELHHSLVEKVV